MSPVNEAAMALITPVLQRICPEGHLDGGGEYHLLNTRREGGDSHTGSFKFNTASGVWADFAIAGATGRYPVSLIRYLDHIAFDEAMHRLESLLGLQPWNLAFGERYRPLTDAERAAAPAVTAKVATAKATQYTPLIPTPEQERTLTGWASAMYHGGVTATWRYCDAKGRFLFAVIRHSTNPRNKGGSKKAFAPVCFVADPRFPDMAPFWRQGQSWPRPLPLYRLDELTAEPETPVVVTEGEKCADAAAQIFPNSIATTSSQGAASAQKTDWSPLAGRTLSSGLTMIPLASSTRRQSPTRSCRSVVTFAPST
jgi:hypothetical protein